MTEPLPNDAEREPAPAPAEPPKPKGNPPKASAFARFWTRYTSVDLRWLGVFRILYGTLLIVDLVRRWSVARFYYTNDGILPNHFSIYRPMGGHLFSIYHAFSTLGEISVAFAISLCFMVAFTLGYRTKLFHVLSVLCITSLNSRNIFVENGGTVVVNILGVWTAFLPLGRRFSIDAVRASMLRTREQVSSELNDRSEQRAIVNSYSSMVVFALMLQWSVIYFFNFVHKNGVGWRNGSAIYWFLQQDRIVTWFGVFMRNHAPYALLKLMTHMTLGVEATLAFVLLVPVARRQMRRLGLLLAAMLHGGIAAMSRLGPFSYVMTMQFVIHLAGEDFELVTRRFARPSRARTLIYDADCGICLFLCRLLKRLDPFERLTFVGNDELERIPEGVDRSLLDQTIVVVLPDGSSVTEERAAFEILRALPFGIVLGFWLRLPGGAELGRYLYRRVATNRLRISAWLGFGECGLRAPEAAAPAVSPATGRSFRTDVAGALVPVREGLVMLLMLVLGVQVLGDNPWASSRVRVQRPEWMAAIVEYPRIYQGWGMFAPEPPYEDGHLVVDARTADGRKLDPFTGKVPDMDPHSATGWGDSQLWCDYTNRLRFPNNAPHRNYLRDYLQHWHEYVGRPQDRLVAFDVWWVGDKEPPPGTDKLVPNPPERLTSFGVVSDSLATPWQQKAASTPPPSIVQARPHPLAPRPHGGNE